MVEKASDKHVVLLHGLGRGKGSMRKLDKALTKARLKVQRIGYPSRMKSIAENISYIESKLPKADPISFVGHSLGGVLSLKLIMRLPKDRRGALVLLGAPVNGASIAGFLNKSGLSREVFGPGLGDLALEKIEPDDLPPTLVFAGTDGKQLFMPGPYIHKFMGNDEPNDGTVLLSETFVEGADNRTVDSGHSFIMNNPEVIRETSGFLLKHH